MAKWYENECRSFDLYENKDGWYYEAVGKEGNLERVKASQIIEALDKIALNEKNGDNKVKGIRIRYGRIDGDLDIRDSQAVERFQETSITYVKLPNIELSFANTVFEGEVRFAYPACNYSTKFEEKVSFSDSKFKEDAFFNNAVFEDDVYFMRVRCENWIKFGRAVFI